MSNRMLIDGTHPEEVRVVITSGNRLEDYDVETSSKKQLKGNIYLAKVTRVEPSLQAAFVDYGGNRHGFLAFSEIHPDYYQIPIADRAALLADREGLEENAKAAQAHIDDIDGGIKDEEPPPDSGPSDDDDDAGEEDAAAEAAPAEDAEAAPAEDQDGEQPEEPVEDEASAAAPDDGRRQRNQHRRYKIQEVIKRRQILLVQVVKEERGNKGAALTSYISLAGRYCVLMPNTSRGGGISRKITSVTSRRKLKSILSALEIPDEMGVIMRTAGMERNRSEIKRDFDYLIRAWDEVRELTLKSTAPTLVYEEASLIKRAIRDLYTKDIEEVLIDGAESYATAKKFMRLLMPSHAKRVQPYRDETIPLFFRYQVEGLLDAMYSPVVQLKSGGYIVFHTTEALIAVDVNSGRSTRERNIEETAVKTNLEAAEEIARQLRLRDLAGLIVIDFIDMEENRNLRSVEKRMKDSMKTDRARLQIGRISGFGLLEMSRQRLRPSLLETSTEPCPHCQNTGFIRSTESAAIHILRAIEEEGIRHRSSEVSVAVSTPVALYILNQKRAALTEIEKRYRFTVTVTADDSIIAPDYRLDRVKAQTAEIEEQSAVSMERVAADQAAEDAEDQAAEDAAAEAEEEAVAEPADGESDDGARRKPRRRRRSRKAADKAPETDPGSEPQPEPVAEEAPADMAAESVEAAQTDDEGAQTDDEGAQTDDEGAPVKRRRRGKRGGRRRSRRAATVEGTEGEETAAPDVAAVAEDGTPPDGEADAGAAPPGEEAYPFVAVTAEVVESEAYDPAHAPQPVEAELRAETVPEAEAMPEPAEAMPEPEATPEAGFNGDDTPELVDAADDEVVTEQAAAADMPPAQPRRRGWWNRLVE